MDALVRVVLSVAILTSTQSLKAALSAPVPALTTVSLNEVIDLSVTSKVTDLKEPIRMDLSRSLFEPQHITSADTDRDRPQGASSTSLPTPILTMNQANTKIADTEDAKTDATIVTDVLQQSKSIDSPETLNNASRDIIPSLVPLRSTTITQGSSIPSSTNHSEEHQNSSQAPTPETFPSVSLIPPSIPASTLKDSINRSASVENENQDEPSELDENLDKAPSPFPLDPLLAGFISVFILSTAVLSILLFLKFRQQSSHPEFHRLQDLPMVSLHYNAFTKFLYRGRSLGGYAVVKTFILKRFQELTRLLEFPLVRYHGNQNHPEMFGMEFVGILNSDKSDFESKTIRQCTAGSESCNSTIHTTMSASVPSRDQTTIQIIPAQY